MKKVQVAEVVGSSICVAVEDGQRVYKDIAAALLSGEEVVVSFRGVSRLTTAFLNAAIGQLYNEFSDEEIRKSVRVDDADSITLNLLKKVVDRAKIFFQDKERIRGIVSREGDDDE